MRLPECVSAPPPPLPPSLHLSASHSALSSLAPAPSSFSSSGHRGPDLFKERVLALRTWLAERPEQCIAVVAHWGLLHELTGGSEFENCQIRTFALDTQPVAAGGEPVLREQVPNLLAALFR